MGEEHQRGSGAGPVPAASPRPPPGAPTAFAGSWSETVCFYSTGAPGSFFAPFLRFDVLSLLLRKNPPLENCNCPQTREHRPSRPRFPTNPLLQAPRRHWGRSRENPRPVGGIGALRSKPGPLGETAAGGPGVEKPRRGEPATQQRGQRGPGVAPGGCGYPPHRPDRNGQGSLYCLNHLAFVSRPHPTQDCALHKTRGSAGAHPATGGHRALPQCPRRGHQLREGATTLATVLLGHKLCQAQDPRRREATKKKGICCVLDMPSWPRKISEGFTAAGDFYGGS